MKSKPSKTFALKVLKKRRFTNLIIYKILTTLIQILICVVILKMFL
jgi:hypothetical protein